MLSPEDIRMRIHHQVELVVTRPSLYGDSSAIDCLLNYQLSLLAAIDERQVDFRIMLANRGLFNSGGVRGALQELFKNCPDHRAHETRRVAAAWSVAAHDLELLDWPRTTESALADFLAGIDSGQSRVVHPPDALNSLGAAAFAIGWDTLIFGTPSGHWAVLDFHYTVPSPGHHSRYNAPASALRLQFVWDSELGCSPRARHVDPPTSDSPSTISLQKCLGHLQAR